MATLDNIQLDASRPWPVTLDGFPDAGVRIRALTMREKREAQARASEVAPPDPWGRTLYRRLASEHFARVMECSKLATRAAEFVQKAQAEASGTLTEETVSTLAAAQESAQEATRLFLRETEEGRVHALSALTDEDPAAGRAIDRFARHLAALRREQAALCIVEWAGAPGEWGGRDDTRAAMSRFPGDVDGAIGDQFAAEVVQALQARELTPVGKASSAPQRGRRRRTRKAAGGSSTRAAKQAAGRGSARRARSGRT